MKADETLYTTYMEGSLRLSRTGDWIHEGTQFTNEKLSALFHRSITWDEGDQRFYVVIGKGRATFDYEDTVFFVSLLCDDRSPWQVQLLDGRCIDLSGADLFIGQEDQIYLTLADKHLARFTRPAHQHLLEHVVSERSIRIDGTEYNLTRLEKDQ